ncbi:hypothetical protein J132_04152 [Termitomyces sp. J132]|nr:hypothetical protein H2248_011849 [Termitomyces sp. 'cryptogamus']KNZ77725.1 hypothetical protein J132_04152 [Termitomyces sp. J132]
MEPFSSKTDRPRDALLLTLHQRELSQKDQKIARLQHANNESLKRHYEAQHRGNTLAQSLGFRDVFEAQMAIDVAGQEVSYRERLERVVRLEEELGEVRRVNEGLRERLRVLEGKERNSEEFDKLQTENQTLLERIGILEANQTRQDRENKTTVSSAAGTISRLEQELAQLQDRYDDLLGVKERAAERYKLDYARWKKVKEWIFDDDKQAEEDKEGMSEEEKKRRFKKSLEMKKRIFKEIEAGSVPTSSPFPKPPPLGGLENKENQTPPPPTPAHSHSTANRIPSLRNKLLDAVAHPKPPSSSPNLFNEGALSRSLLPKPQEPIFRNHQNSDPPSSPSPADVTTLPRSSPTVVGTASKPLGNKLLDSVCQTKVPFSSPTIPLSNGALPSSSSRKPLVFEPITIPRPRSTSIHVRQENETELSPLPLVRQQDGASSETEDDSQVVENNVIPAAARIIMPSSPSQTRSGIPIIPTSPAPILSSETEPDSQSQMFSLPFLDPTPCPTRPAKVSLVQYQIPAAQTQPEPNLPAKPAFPRNRRVVSSRDEESSRARKVMRVDEEEGDENQVTTLLEPKSSVTVEERNEKEKEKERKGKQRERHPDVDIEVPSSTPANPPPTAPRGIEDYSVYKGRGRYGKNVAAPKDSTTINAQFEIDPSRNEGFDFQYDQVVRGKRDRKRMEAGDCECCRDYYEAVGPLPKRLQAPLWRSPLSTPVKSSPRPCPRHGSGSKSASASKSKSENLSANSNSHRSNTFTRQYDNDKENEIVSHRQAISRHRHHWERPKTPPGYWNIGFPDTQEAEEINEMAREMHRKKKEEVEREVESGRDRGRGDGRWRRRV